MKTDKDLFGSHCPVREVGYRVPCLKMPFGSSYTRKDCSVVFVPLFVDGFLAKFLFAFRLRFCVACGRFIGFDGDGVGEFCWICEDYFEDFEGVELKVSGGVCPFDMQPCAHVGSCDAVLGLGEGCERSKK